MKKIFEATTAIILLGAAQSACNSVLGFDDLQEGVCLQNTKQCNGNTPQSCIDGQWKDVPTGPCANQTCTDGACIGECAPGKRCVGPIVQVCDSSGKWMIESTCTGVQVCIAGSCIAECTQGDLRCHDNSIQTCAANGFWNEGQHCVASTCDSITATCIGVCEQGEMQCLDNVPRTCNVVGQWIGNEPCTAGQICSSGTCVDKP